MRATFLATVATIVLTASTALAQSEGEFPAKLAGHVVMPAATFIDAPADAPADLKTSGKYTTGRRVDAIGSVMGKSNDRPTGVLLPFKGQPLQGHSGITTWPASLAGNSPSLCASAALAVRTIVATVLRKVARMYVSC